MPPPTGEGPRFWDQLLQVIEEGRVVPVVGPDLLIVEAEGRRLPLDSLLAERLAAYLEVPAEGLPAAGALHEVASRFLAQGGELEDVYPALKSVMPGPEEIRPPEALLQLARIRPLKLFVTTTFDPLLQRALDEVRYGGQPRTRVLAYAPTAVQDLDRPIKELDGPLVFHLFGRISAVPDYVVTEEDALEVLHALQSESLRPDLLLDEIGSHQILALGVRLQSWLARFFLRLAKRERLWLARGKTDILAGEHLRDDAGLMTFLQRFSSRTKVYQGGGAADLVAELSRRWSEKHPATEAAPEPAPAEVRSPLEMEPGAVFLSYASEDRPLVEALREELESAGVDVWFDREALQGGDDYEAKIKRNIESCSLFVPILSQHTLTSRRRFFRIEWDWAERVAVQVPPTLRYLMPVVAGDVSPNDPALPERFRKLHWLRLEPGKPNSEIVAALKQGFREYHRALAGTP